MANGSDYLESQLGGHILGDSTFAKPFAIYCALFTTAPGEDGSGGVEVSGGGYARVQAGPGLTYWSEGNAGVFLNAQLITFPVPTADWGTVSHVAIMDAATDGNYLIIVPLDTPTEVIGGGQPIQFGVGALQVTFD